MAENMGGMGFFLKTLGFDPKIIMEAGQTVVSIGEQVKEQLDRIEAKVDALSERLNKNA